MTTTLAAITDLLKYVYLDQLNEQLDNSIPTLNYVNRTSNGVFENAGGKGVVFPIHTRRNQGIGARQEMEALPTAGSQKSIQATAPLRYLYGSLSMDGQTMQLANSNVQAFVNAMTHEVERIKDDLAVDVNRQVWGNGNGQIAAASAGGTTTNTITCATTGVVNVQLGMVIDIYSSDGLTARASSRNVTAINSSTGVVTFDGAAVASISIGDMIVRTGSVGTSTIQRELTGFGKIIQSSGALFGVTDAVWVSSVDSNGGTARALSEGLMIKMADAIADFSGKIPNVIFCTRGVRRSYFNLVSQQRRFTGPSNGNAAATSYTGGTGGLEFIGDNGSIPITVDKMAPLRTMTFVNTDALTLYRQNAFNFMDKDGSIWDRIVTSSGRFDGYEATLYSYCELGTSGRNRHGQIQDITES
jgi:hypothetical protein